MYPLSCGAGFYGMSSLDSSLAGAHRQREHHQFRGDDGTVILLSVKKLAGYRAVCVTIGMPREFSLHIGSGGRCVIKEEDNTLSEFADILSAVMYVRQRVGEESAVLTVYDAHGKEAFRRSL